LRLRSIRFVPGFAFHTTRSLRQVRRAAGFRGGAVLPDRSWAFWTMTAWDSQADMRAYMRAGAHGAAMPRLMAWCDEASVVHWEAEDAGLPGWDEADRRMRESGRASKLRYPSAAHAGLEYAAPRLGRAVAIGVLRG
jgi:hypothetical protein